MVELRIFGTRLTVARLALAELVAIWGGITWVGVRTHPRRGIWRGALVGLVAVPVLVSVEVGHAVAHIFSARYAGAPMDELRLSGEMPRTLYADNTVSPTAHRVRALGGPLFNLIGSLVSSAVYQALPPRSLARELAAYAAVGHALQLGMSLLPLPMVDGGTLLKWTLVARGRTESEADETVRSIDWTLGLAGGTFGVGLIATGKWTAGSLLVGASALVAVIAGRPRSRSDRPPSRN